MREKIKYSLLLLLFTICGITLIFGKPTGNGTPIFQDVVQNTTVADKPQKQDTSKNLYPVRKTQITTFQDLKNQSPIDLVDPSNVKTKVEYDINNNVYLFKTQIDNDEWITPFTLNPDEYSKYALKESMKQYFKAKNDNELANLRDNKVGRFSLKDIKVNTGALERVFGPGGIKFKTQGYVELSAGMKHTSIDNPTLSEKNRSRTMFDFSEKIQANVAVSVGEKVNFDLNYDTQATFDFDTKKIKLAYEGDEDEIIKYLEAGNVSLRTTNSLISGGSSLFGIRADLQFGKLKVNTVLSQQNGEARTITAQGGTQTTTYEFMADKYEENQHFYLAEYFRDNYDVGMSKLPYVISDIQITKMEVWVTNRNGNFSNARDIVAFADLGEYNKIHNTAKWQKQGALSIPYNNANTLYNTLNNQYPGIRNIDDVTQIMNSAGLESGQDYEKIASARKLDASEYTYNTQLGYLSLTSSLSSDQVLAVAIEYTHSNGQSYKLGEFASEVPSNYVSGQKSGALILKLIKPVSLSPISYSWNMMMKNVYNLGNRDIQKEKFRLNISYQNDSTGTYVNYLSEGAINGEMLLRVMNLDRLNAQSNTQPDGIFDFLPGYTINTSTGRIYFPEVEPFGAHLRKKINNNTIADKYVYQQLYDSTLTVAKQYADKNKFKISGSMLASQSSSQINLNSMNVTKGSVKVTANGQMLVENVDYTVDYSTGAVTIINQSLIDSNATINVTSENQSLLNMQRKTLLGLNLSYDFTKNFTLGGTIVHLSEKPLSVKTGIGFESVQNTVWGLNTAYKTEAQWLTNLIDKLPFVNATAPSQIALTAEFAQMIPGHYNDKYSNNSSYLDDFESAKSKISVLSPYGWKLASTPYDNTSGALFPEASLSNDIQYGNNRAHLAWFTIDNIFTRKRSSLRPRSISLQDASHPFVREVYQYEIYPSKDITSTESSTLATLNLSYYPQERGMYNLDATNINSEGKLLNPEKRWGGISRKIDNTDFESNNIEYIEFWMMDPFIDNDTAQVKKEGGDIYFNLGNVSEDILKDGKKFYENGLPINDDPSAYTTTVWGRVPTKQSTVYAFDNQLSLEDRRKQDVGLSGLTDDNKLLFPTYVEYLNSFKSRLSPQALANMLADEFSPINDLTGDKYHYFRGSDYDSKQLGILDRYKRYNGLAGNSITDENESFSTAATSNPDVEDLNQDYTLSETESYFQYKVSLDPNNMKIGNNYISDIRETQVRTIDDKTHTARWYLFKVPLKEYQKKIGSIQNFKTIRFMRMFLTNFKQTTYLRFATLDLVRGEWRAYTQQQNDGINQGTGALNVSAVNIEENSDMRPVNYVLPPGVTRIVDPNQAQLTQENEQSLALKVVDLQAKDARAVYKSTNFDLRRYKRIQMFTHAEELINGPSLAQGEITVFMRLGSDYVNNYYEYEIPMTITPAAPEPNGYSSNNAADQLRVWPKENMFDFPLELLVDLKLKRNKEKRKAGSTVSYDKIYSEYDPQNVNNKVSVIGNPSISSVGVIMIGIRNNSRQTKSATIWVDELRVNEFDEQGGWAAQGNLNVSLSDIGSVSFTGRKETSGFGSVDQGLMQRRQDDFYSYNIATQLDLGRFLPEKAKLRIPFYYGYSNQTTTPKYDPFNQDVKMSKSLDAVETQIEKDSIKALAQEKTTTRNMSLNNVKIDIKSKKPMPYDPANFTFGYAYSIMETKNPTTVYDQTKNYKASLNYSYSPQQVTWQPFKDIKSKSPIANYPRTLGINLLPSNIAFNTYITRYYTETRTRDLDSYVLGADNSKNQFLSWSQNFYWDRDFSISWDLLSNLKISIQTGTRAEIEEPYLQVNKKLNRGDYEIWRDSVIQSIKHLGNPLSYRQTAKVVYTLPFNRISFLDWINSAASYESNYTWDRGAHIDDSTSVGNTITNNMTLSLQGNLDMTSLYNKSPFLKKVNQKFETNRRRFANNNRREQVQKKQPKPKPFALDVALNLDSATIVTHGLKTKRIEVSAKKEGKPYKVKFKKIDENTIKITTKDSIKVQINVVVKGDEEESTLYQIAQYAARGLMSVRTISLNYSSRQETAIEGFIPGVGDFFGQKKGNSGMTPGVGFAFGLSHGEDYIHQALANKWLLLNEASINPAVDNSISKLSINAELEPFRGLHIQLNALRERNDRKSIKFNNAPSLSKTYGGSFSMTTISLATAFESSNANNNYKSATFDRFLKNRAIIASRLEDKYKNVSYPQNGFIPGTGISGQYDPTISSVDKNSADVLVPAFLAAYTGRNSGSITLSPFPLLSSILPNWTLTYDGLTTLPWFKEKFKSVRLSHSYSSIYSVGSYSSFGTWTQASDDMGFIQNLDGIPTPSSQYDISSVNIVEQFNPLFGADAILLNNMTIKARYNYSRMLNLNISSYQIVETVQKDFVVGLGYKINEFNKIIGIHTKNNRGFNNELNINADLSSRRNQSLLRKIDEGYTDATAGSTILTLKLSAEYSLSRFLLLRAFYDRVVNKPLMSNSSYPTANSNFGISIRFSLTQ